MLQESSGLVPLEDNVWYFPASTTVGVIDIGGGRALLVDAGLDESAARKLLRVLQEANLFPAAVVVTHAHADHSGACATLAARAGVRVLASPIEADVIRHPEWEPLYLFGGAWPPPRLRNKFILAPTCPVAMEVAPGPLAIPGFTLEAAVEIVPLPGHSPGQIGVSTNGVLFSGDAFFPPAVLDKHKIPFFVDIAATLNTLGALLQRPEGIVVPGHGAALADPQPAVAANAGRLVEIAGLVLESLSQPAQIGDIVSFVADRLQLVLETETLYYLTQTAIQAHLSRLAEEKAITAHCRGNRLYWERR